MGKGLLVALIVVVALVVVAGAWVGAAYGVTRATGPVVTQDRTIPAFTKVDVSGKGTMFITQGAPSLTIEARQGILDRLETRVDGDTLRVGFRSRWLGIDVFWGDEPITYHLTVPDLAAVKLSGAVEVKGEGAFEAKEFAIECSGSSDVTLEVRADNLRLDTSGSSNITLTGQVDTFACDTSGSTNVDARDLVSRTATVDCSGSSDIEVNAGERLDVNASGSSTVAHVGAPIITTNISGSGEVRQVTR